MGSLERRLRTLESRHETAFDKRCLSREALRRLSDEDLDALEDGIEEALESGMREATFEDLYAVISERSRRAMEVYFEIVDAWREGREPPEVKLRDPPNREPKNGYRIWKYKKQLEKGNTQ